MLVALQAMYYYYSKIQNMSILCKKQCFHNIDRIMG